MSNGKLCNAHHIPTDICARCKGAAEEQNRIIGELEKMIEAANRCKCQPCNEIKWVNQHIIEIITRGL